MRYFWHTVCLRGCHQRSDGFHLGPLTQVRVEVHLYDGTVTVDELGPTPNVDLAPGESHDVTLPVEGQSFTEWVAHPEVGPRSAGGGEHGGQGGEGAEGGGN